MHDFVREVGYISSSYPEADLKKLHSCAGLCVVVFFCSCKMKLNFKSYSVFENLWVLLVNIASLTEYQNLKILVPSTPLRAPHLQKIKFHRFG